MEATSRHIHAKFDLASQLVAASAGGEGLEADLEAVRTRYTLCTGHLFLKAALGESSRALAREEYQRIVASENIVGDLDNIVRRARLAAQTPAEDGGKKGRGRATAVGPRGRELRTLIEQYEGHEVDCAARAVAVTDRGAQYNMCPDCHVEMAVSPDTSELECFGCGKVRGLIGTVFDDAQFYNQEGQKAKSGSFNPNRHFRYWMERILAREPEEELGCKDDPDNTCGEKLLADLRRIVRRDNRILRLITVNDVRAMLKEVGRTDLNKNVPLIMKKMTGVGPPQLSEAFCQRIEKLFSKAIEIGERVRPSGRTNRNYYPYYIYKILDAVLDEKDLESRRVMFYIYMQGKDTLDKNDREWEDICFELPEIVWTPTDRAKAAKYRPQ